MRYITQVAMIDSDGELISGELHTRTIDACFRELSDRGWLTQSDAGRVVVMTDPDGQNTARLTDIRLAVTGRSCWPGCSRPVPAWRAGRPSCVTYTSPNRC